MLRSRVAGSYDSKQCGGAKESNGAKNRLELSARGRLDGEGREREDIVGLHPFRGEGSNRADCYTQTTKEAHHVSS